MKKRVFVLLVLVLSAAGCGGGNDGDSAAAVVPQEHSSPFAGVWSGAGADPGDGGQIISMDLSVDTAGAVSGSIAIGNAGNIVALSGSIDKNGVCRFSYTVAGSTYGISGSFAINGAGDRISGSLGIDVEGVQIGVSLFVLTRQ